MWAQSRDAIMRELRDYFADRRAGTDAQKILRDEKLFPQVE